MDFVEVINDWITGLVKDNSDVIAIAKECYDIEDFAEQVEGYIYNMAEDTGSCGIFLDIIGLNLELCIAWDVVLEGFETYYKKDIEEEIEELE